ncbi:MAG: DNA polymerase I [Clostridiales bacterium]|jgi:DNA polymerase-1|nr:DNA polymerase I [Clostridiales bacterium]
MSEKRKERLVILDSNSLLNRAFYAIPLTLKTKDGLVVNAVYGYITMLAKILSSLAPTHLAAAFDVGKPTFRHEKYKDYKGTRKPMPPELIPQMSVMRDLLKIMKINPLEKEGFEADDVIGTLAKSFDGETVIVTGDRDLLQTVSESVTVWLTKKGVSEVEEYDLKRLQDEGLEPKNIIDLKAVMGDASDNIPGVFGIGEVGAAKLVKEYKTLDNIYENLDKIGGKVAEKLIDGKDSAYLSKWLATIDTDAPIDCGKECYVLSYPFSDRVREAFLDLSMKSVISRFEFKEASHENADKIEVKAVGQSLPNTIAEWKEIFRDAKKKGTAAAVVFSDKISFASDQNTEYTLNQEYDLFQSREMISTADFVNALNESGVPLYVFDLKTIKHKLKSEGVTLKNIAFDVLLGAYLADSNNNYSDFDRLLEYFNLKTEYRAVGLLQLSELFQGKIKEAGLEKVYSEIDFPLIDVLFEMENDGFCVDEFILDELSEKYTAEINQLRKKIIEIAGENFNVNSPKQLNVILFEKLGLPATKKNKSGGFSSSADILTELIDVHPIIPFLLRYRQLTKLQSTYIEGFRDIIASDGKIHTVFKNALTTTGRLSSAEPNMQNIPVREAEGRELRKMFVPSKGCVLVSADYSQIELRLLADFSNDEHLINAFLNGEDIHAATAAKIFSVRPDEVTKEMRRTAKTVNFGIIYGISDFGLSSGLGIRVKDAKQFIGKYFELYPSVKTYMDANVAFAREHGYIKTYFGRIRYLPEIRSSNFPLRGFSERAAMNMPLQGSAADIIKIAMVRVANLLKKKGLKSRLIMSVHDELVIDTRTEEVAAVKELLKEAMENAVHLKIPLTVEMGEGKTWLK